MSTIGTGNYEVRLCTRPDSVCLQGGCGYCSTGNSRQTRWWSIDKLERYAFTNNMLEDFRYGYEHRWPNRDKRVARAR